MGLALDRALVGVPLGAHQAGETFLDPRTSPSRLVATFRSCELDPSSQAHTLMRLNASTATTNITAASAARAGSSNPTVGVQALKSPALKASVV